MISISGYCLKYGETIASHPPVLPGALMHGLATIEGIPVYIAAYSLINHFDALPNGVATIFNRKDGVYCNIRLLDSYDNMVDELSKLKIGCFANEIKRDKDNNIIDGRIRYVNLCDTNIEKIEEIGVI